MYTTAAAVAAERILGRGSVDVGFCTVRIEADHLVAVLDRLFMPIEIDLGRVPVRIEADHLVAVLDRLFMPIEIDLGRVPVDVGIRGLRVEADRLVATRALCAAVEGQSKLLCLLSDRKSPLKRSLKRFGYLISSSGISPFSIKSCIATYRAALRAWQL